MANYTARRNKNRGYMQLDVWQKAIDLFKLVWKIVYSETQVEYKLRAQIADSTQSVSSNIAEGYSRRSINEYLQYLYISLSSLSETLTRAVGLKETNCISEIQFNKIDELHYEVENKLLRLIESLESKRENGTWINRISDKKEEYTI